MHPKPGFYCIETVAKRESALRIHLQRAGLLALCPREVYWIKPAKRSRDNPGRRWVPKERPLFTRLVFVKAAELADWRKINAAPFVRGVLSMAGEYYRLSDDDVTMLYNVDGLEAPAPAESRTLKPADKAKITVGAFAGHACEVQTIAGKRAKVLLMLLGSLKVVDLPVAALEAV